MAVSLAPFLFPLLVGASGPRLLPHTGSSTIISPKLSIRSSRRFPSSVWRNADKRRLSRSKLKSLRAQEDASGVQEAWGEKPQIIIIRDEDRIKCLQFWMSLIDSKEQSGIEGSRDIMNKMLWFNDGAVGTRKRQFSLAVVRGGAVDAVVSLKLTPDNSDFLSFLQSKYLLTVEHIAVSPTRAGSGAGSKLIQGVKDLAKKKRWNTSYEPLRNVYGGRFYLASKT